MSVNNPPNPDISTFNNLYWITADTNLTQSIADLRYLKFPVAQGTENLQAININGTATFNSGATFNNSTTFENSATFDSSANFNSDTNFSVIPTSSAIQPLATDSSTKIPTTAWVQSAIAIGGGGGGGGSNIYLTNQTVTMPTNCRSIDVLLMGRGGLAGATVVDGGITYYGGSGSGGNTLSCSNIPMSEGEQFTLTFDATGSSITYNSVVIMKAFSGSTGGIGVIGANVAGASSNTTSGIADTNLGSFYNTFGNAGAGSTSSGTVPPSMAVLGTGCPKGTTTWVAGKYGCAQRITSDATAGFILITYHST